MKRMIDVRVTVIIPVRNGAKWIRESVDSILEQTHDNLELVVVDDGSTDDTPEILRGVTDSRLRVLRNDKTEGVCGALNRGLGATENDFIARMDADDISMPRRLERQLTFMIENPKVAACGTWAIEVDDNGRYLGFRDAPTGERLDRGAWYPSPLISPSTMMRRSILGDACKFDYPDFVEDYHLWFRLASSGHSLANIPEYLLLYRVHPESASSTTATRQAAASRSLFRQFTGRDPGEEDYLSFRSCELTPIAHARTFIPAAHRAWFSLSAMFLHELRYARLWRGERKRAASRARGEVLPGNQGPDHL